MFIAELIDGISSIDKSTVDHQPNGALFFLENRRKYRCHVMGSRKQEWPQLAGYLKGLLPRLRQAHVLRFENLPMKTGREDYNLPRPTEDGYARFNSGEATVPFDTCWLEYDIPAGRSAAFLVERRDSELAVHEFIRYPEAGGSTLKVTCFAMVVRPSELRHDKKKSGSAAIKSWNGIEYWHDDPLGQVPVLTELMMMAVGEASSQKMLEASVSDMMFFVYLLLVLKSRERSIETVKPGVIANRRRSDKGLFRYPDSHLVRLSDGWSPGEEGL